MDNGGKMSLPPGVAAPACEGRLHFGFRVNSQSVSDAVDVIEIGNHFHRIENVAVIQLVFFKLLDISPPNGGGRASHEFSEFA